MPAAWDLLGEAAELEAKRLSKKAVDVGTPVAQKGKGVRMGVSTSGSRGTYITYFPRDKLLFTAPQCLEDHAKS
jgi:hypothetical protein